MPPTASGSTAAASTWCASTSASGATAPSSIGGLNLGCNTDDRVHILRSGHGSRETPRLQLRDLSRHQVRRCGFGNFRSRGSLEDTANEFTVLSASRAVACEHIAKDLVLGLGIVRRRSVGTFAGGRSNTLGSVAILQRPSLLRTRWTRESVGPRRTSRGTICSGSEVLARNDRCRTHSGFESGCLSSRLGNRAGSYCELLASEV